MRSHFKVRANNFVTTANVRSKKTLLTDPWSQCNNRKKGRREGRKRFQKILNTDYGFGYAVERIKASTALVS